MVGEANTHILGGWRTTVAQDYYHEYPVHDKDDNDVTL